MKFEGGSITAGPTQKQEHEAATSYQGSRDARMLTPVLLSPLDLVQEPISGVVLPTLRVGLLPFIKPLQKALVDIPRHVSPR